MFFFFVFFCVLNSRTHIFFKEFTDVVVNLPDEDKPSYFGLPSNIERSAQRIVSGQVSRPIKTAVKNVLGCKLS